VRGWQLEAPRCASCFSPRLSSGKEQRAITESAVQVGGATHLDAGDSGMHHLVNSGGVWATIIAAAALHVPHALTNAI
jgi:hypothetical protein